MLGKIIKLFAGKHYRKFLKECEPIVRKINALDQEYQSWDVARLKENTLRFKERFQKGETLDSLLPEAFATVKSAARLLIGQKISVCGQELIWNMVHYDVQLIGGIALHKHYIAEMATGEGKTLVATLPLYLNALTGRNCQLVTVNDYLARRDSQWMGYLYDFLGVSVGCIQHDMYPKERYEAYRKDITYGTSSEFGFDYLRDNGMAVRPEDQVQREHFFCIVDEIDSILVDEARTPLIISGVAEGADEGAFLKLKPGVERLVRTQMTLCTELLEAAKKNLESQNKDEVREALEKMYQAKQGMPKHRLFLRLMEEGKYRKMFDRIEAEMAADFQREKAYALKEELYFTIDEKQNQADLTEKGRNTLRPNDAQAFVLPDLPTLFSELEVRQDLDESKKQTLRQQAEEEFARKSEDIHCLSQLLRAYSLYDKDDQYVVMDGKVVIIDENTGRAMPGRRWSDGLHQAVEAKEGVVVEKESKTYATITIQNYFRMYEKLAGMTGTAETEAQEFFDIYRLKVMVIPTHKPCIRVDENDVIFKTRRAKYKAVLKDIETAYAKGQPVLVGTVSVDASELLSKMLKRSNIPHTVLNAKYHQQEAEIIAKAGRRGAVTIATNMAGRGTDIKLDDGVDTLGGLLVLGTERHESRRIDRQLRGRCARQGDPGKSKFFISLEDDLMRLFAHSGPIGAMLEKSMAEDEELTHPWLNRSIESAQKKVEQHNYSIRKRLLQYDDVLNRQREIVYGLRNEALKSDNLHAFLFEFIEDEVTRRIELLETGPKGLLKEKDLNSFLSWANLHFPVFLKKEECAVEPKDNLVKGLLEKIQAVYKEKLSVEGDAALKQLEQYLIVSSIDKNWQDHLTEMEDLRQSVNLRGYGQKDPLNEYKTEAYGFFEEMMGRVRQDICYNLFRSATSLNNLKQTFSNIAQKVQFQQESTVQGENVSDKEIDLPKPIKRALPKVGRNEACPCGSGKKYKKCCGIDAE